MKYIGKITDEGATSLTARFLERRDNGSYEIKKKAEETDKSLVFMRDVRVKWIGPGRYEVPDQMTLKKRHEEHWKMLRLREKVYFIQCNLNKFNATS